MNDLIERYRGVRARTVELCRPLSIEDHGVQSMPDASPAKWHLAHTTWFFETFLLNVFVPAYVGAPAVYQHLFNSYYNGVGEPFERARRGTLSRPTVAEVHGWRAAVDAAMERLLGGADPEVARLTQVGLHHEQQHQELLLTDVKHALGSNPLKPAYVADFRLPAAVDEDGWCAVDGGVVTVGHDGDGFAWDNERPAHDALLRPFRLATRLVTQGEVLAFVEAGGYREPSLWLSEGWDRVCADGWRAPLYWEATDEGWSRYTLAGMRPVEDGAPALHLSYFEADAFARWSGARLPTEFEWEHAARSVGTSLRQLTSVGWQWTSSAYAPYPGYVPYAGALGEYNGKFMCNQMVLRGGSLATPEGHGRRTYRNFFAPDKRWQFTGVRLCRDD